MKIKIVVHDADEGGYWAEVPAIPGCATQGETMDELMANLREAIEAYLGHVGRMKLISPIYRALAATEAGKAQAKAIYKKVG
eukprot:gene48470-65768_t